MKHQPLKVEYRKTSTLKPHPKNARAHSPAQIDAIGRSIQAVGWTKPIVVDEKLEILAGHGAHQAAQQLGLDQVPTIQRAGLTAAQKKAYRIADNRIAENSTWDDGLLAGELADLKRMGYDLSLTGFDPSEVEAMLNPPTAEPTEPPVPDLQKRTVSKLGDLWLLGEHRLICGDATKPAIFTSLMQGRKAQCVFTDPPYGVSYAKSAVGEVKGDDLRRGQLKGLLNGAFASAMKHTREDAGWYVWHASGTREDFGQALRDNGLVELALIIWEKPSATMGWGDYRQAHEPCFYAARQGTKPAFYGDRTGTTVWRVQQASKGEPTAIGNGLIISGTGQEVYLTTTVPKGKKLRHMHLDGTPLLLSPKSDTDDLWQVSRESSKDGAIHPTMKPVELARRACRNSTLEGEIILDMFSGSGSTIIAAEQTKRVGYAIEIDPQYVDASIRRWQTLTGKQAIHAQSKKTFDATANSSPR